MPQPDRPTQRRSRTTFNGRGTLMRAGVIATTLMLAAASFAMARQATDAGGAAADPAAAANGAATAAPEISIWQLFAQSFDFFTIVLVIASIAAWAIIVITIIEVREGNLLPPDSEEAVRKLAGAGQWAELRKFTEEDTSFVSRVVLAGLNAPGDDKESVREAAELEASEQCARCFRRIEPLNVIGNLGPLLGLAGTVWGMVIAFAALGQAGGQASPANLSTGISKALFHTLLGLLLALPALAVFGFYRARIDRICNRAMISAAGLVEMLPAPAATRRRAENSKAANQQSSK
ncbi:MAG: MotA/TolQ/ExbB proton channel family protein [Phycisphaerales bacterium]